MLLAEAKLFFAENHAGGLDAADGVALQLCYLTRVAIDQHGTFGSKRDFLASGDVRSAADDRSLAFAGVDGSEAEAVGVGVGLHAEDRGDADEVGVPIATDSLPALNFGDCVGDLRGEFGDGQIDIDVLAEP